MSFPSAAKQAASSNPSAGSPMSEQGSNGQHVPAVSLRPALRHDTIDGNIVVLQSDREFSMFIYKCAKSYKQDQLHPRRIKARPM
jgi:hypothetical protein